MNNLRIRRLDDGVHVLEEKRDGAWVEISRYPTLEWAWVALQQALMCDDKGRRDAK
mgnify:CR=1 FL=1